MDSERNLSSTLLITVWSPGFSRLFALWLPKGGTPYGQIPESNKVELDNTAKTPDADTLAGCSDSSFLAPRMS